MTRSGLVFHVRETLVLARRWRIPISLLAGAAMWLGAVGRIDDWQLFVQVARSDNILRTYNAHPHFQSGPLTIILMWVAATLGRPLTSVLCFAALPVLQMRLERWLRRDAPLSGHLVLAIAWGAAIASGHLDDMAASIALLLAAVHNMHSRWIAGLWVGVAICFKPWAIIGVPLALSIPGMLTAGAITAGFWSPFLLFGGAFKAVADGARVQPQSLLSLFISPGDPYPYWWRPAQLTFLLCLAIILSRRFQPVASVAFASLARIVLEPALWQYYYISPAIFGVTAGLRTSWLLVSLFVPLIPGLVGTFARVISILMVPNGGDVFHNRWSHGAGHLFLRNGRGEVDRGQNR